MPEVVVYLAIFVGLGVFFLFFHLMLGKLVRPIVPESDKLTIYECGEPTIGSAWVQFDLRYYVVALLFVIFDVELAFFFPWAVVFGKANTLSHASLAPADRVAVTKQLVPDPRFFPAVTRDEDNIPAPTDEARWAPWAEDNRQAANWFGWIGLVDILVFFGVLLVGFAYLWKRGDLNWVRTTVSERVARVESPVSPTREEELIHR
jgi:NADH-quinone oxidoreductase subunit A